jgi:hypothetical protein
MSTILFILAAALALGAVVLFMRLYVGALCRYHGERLVVCPENDEFAAVAVDARRAASAALAGRRPLRLEKCSRWPKMQACDQQCLSQIEAAPADCLARNILTNWYDNSECVVCKKKIGKIDWTKHKPALLSPGRGTLAWSEVPTEKLPEVLASHWPVCWDCHVIEKLVREHPRRVTFRPPHRSAGIAGSAAVAGDKRA